MLEPIACRIFMKSKVSTQSTCSKLVLRNFWTKAVKRQIRGAKSRHEFFSIGNLDVITAMMLPEISMLVSFMSAMEGPWLLFSCRMYQVNNPALTNFNDWPTKIIKWKYRVPIFEVDILFTEIDGKRALNFVSVQRSF
jgi:hypothetical protein